jgi:nucleotide-binding universal stress UspA family protein
MLNSMFNRILVAVDGSPASLHALKETCRLARAEHGSIGVVSVVPPHDGELRLVGVSNVIEKTYAQAERARDEAVRVAELEGISVKAYVLQGEPHEAIVSLAEEEQYDVIALGVRGHNVAENLLMGSAAAQVIGFSDIPVLVIPLESRLAWERVLVPVDGSAPSQAAARLAFQLVDVYGSKLLVVSVADVPLNPHGFSLGAGSKMVVESRRHLNEVAVEAKAHDVIAEYMLREGRPEEVLIAVANQRSPNLIILGSRGRTRLTKLFVGSVTESVIQGSPCPILVVRDSLPSEVEQVAEVRSSDCRVIELKGACT